MNRRLTLVLPPLFGSLIWQSPIAAQRGELTFQPERPRAGQEVRAVYRRSAALTGDRRLHLRARLRTPEHESYNDGIGSRTVAVLERERDGTYRSRFSLPRDVVYAAFAVENVAATRTDSREGRFWELLVHGMDGRPRFDALEQRFNDHMGRDDLEVLETARTTVRLYADRPQAWSTLRAAEGWVLGEERAAERLAVHRDRLRAFDQSLGQARDLSPDEVGHLYWYARVLRDEDIAERWKKRLLAEHPGHFFAVQERVNDLGREHRADPVAFLRELEALWGIARGRTAQQRIVWPAVSAAQQTGDASAILRWAERAIALDSSRGSSVAMSLANTSATREEGIRRLEAEIAAAERVEDERRVLGAPAGEHREASARRIATLRTALGQSLVAAGRTDEGIAALERAAAIGWNTGRFRSLGEARLAAGDRSGAVRAFAAVAADPGISAAAADSLRLAAGLDSVAWTQAVARVREQMLERTLHGARAEPIKPVRLTTRDGSPVRLDRHLGDAATVVVVWSRHCQPSVQAMPRIAALAERLAADGIPLLAVTRDPPAEAEAFIREGGWKIRVFYDTDGEMARALNSWGTPQYFVLDRAGRLRFAFTSLDDLPRQVTALRAEGQRPVSPMESRSTQRSRVSGSTST